MRTVRASIQRRLAAYARQERKIQRAINLLAACRIAVFLALVVSIAAAFGGNWQRFGIAGALASAGIFLFLMVRHDRCYREKRRRQLLQALLRDDLARVENRFADLAYERPISFDERHPFAHDLDLTGKFSILKLIDDAYHDRAKLRLQRWIDHADGAAAIGDRQQAVRDLARRKRFRLKWSLAARLDSLHDLDPADLESWLAEPAPWTAKPAAYWLGRAWSAVTAYAVLTEVMDQLYMGGDPFWASAAFLPWLPIVVVQLALFYGFGFVHNRYLAQFMARGKPIAATCAMVRSFERARFSAPLLDGLQRRLLRNGRAAGPNLTRLMGVGEMLSYRSSAPAHFVLNLFFLWDQHHLRRLVKWRAAYGDSLPGWIETIFEIEALAALANFDWLFPQRPFPDLVDADKVYLEARDLGHPAILAEDRVGNDYALTDNGVVHLVTGSNMSGKSTFLRAIGANLILARLGAPVCAASMRCSLPKIWTSVRIQDSLAEGVSYFYAEVQRLKQILEDVAGEDGATLFLLDEILKGTNSRERQIACKAMIDFLIRHGASGLITTHDLELLALQATRPKAIANYHFQEQTRGDEMFFDYKLKPGSLTSTNALRVMKFAGVPLQFPEETDPS